MHLVEEELLGEGSKDGKWEKVGHSLVTLEQVSSGIWVGPSGASCLYCQPLCCSLYCIEKPILKHESDWVATGREWRIALEKDKRAKIKTGRKTGV